MKVNGLKEIGKALNQLPKELQKKPVFFALRKGGKTLIPEIQVRVPVRSGNLGSSITVAKANKRERSKAQIRIGFRPPHSRRAHFTEFGTFNQPAQPFVRPALSAGFNRFVEVTGAEMGKSIIRISKKLAGPSLKKSGLKLK